MEPAMVGWPTQDPREGDGDEASDEWSGDVAQNAVQCPPISAGPNERPGFMEAPLMRAAQSPANAT